MVNDNHLVAQNIDANPWISRYYCVVTRTLFLVMLGALASAMDPPTGVVALVPAHSGADIETSPGGSAVVIHRDGTAISLAEALPTGDEFTVALPGGRRRPARVVLRHADSTAVLLRISDLPSDVVPIETADSRRMGMLDPVWTAGNSARAIELDGIAALSLGVVSGLYDIPTDAPPVRGRSGRELSSYRGAAIETDAAINDGNEGGALLDNAGRLVALVCRGQVRERRLPVAVPIHRILDALGLPAPLTAPAGGGERWRSAAARAAAAMTLVYLERPNGLGNPAGVPRPPRAVADAPQSERERLSSWWEMYWHQQQVIYTDQSVPAFAVAPDLLLTAASNLHGNAKHGTAQLPEGGIACSVIAIDSPRDLALLRCERPHNLAIATLSATAPQLGSRVALLSRHQSEIGWTATLGTISATNRRRVQSRLSFLQTDARANYGSLGGALIDDMGFVVGMCVKLGPSSDQPWLINSGVALATGSIGINEALSVLREGRSTDTPPIIGMGIVPRERNRRLYIDHVTANTGAEAAGLVIGDELLRVDGVNVFSRDSLSRMLLRKKSGDIIAVELRRGEQTITVNVELREFTP